jgi:hypothetical protein
MESNKSIQPAKQSPNVDLLIRERNVSEQAIARAENDESQEQQSR